MKFGTESIYSMDWWSKSQIVCCSEKCIQVWDLTTQRLVNYMQFTDVIYHINKLRDNILVYFGDKKYTIITDLTTRKVVRCDDLLADVFAYKPFVNKNEIVYCIKQKGIQVFDMNLKKIVGLIPGLFGDVDLAIS